LICLASPRKTGASLLSSCTPCFSIKASPPGCCLNCCRPWRRFWGRGSHYKVRAYPIDSRDQFLFVSDLTVRGKAALVEMGVELGWRQQYARTMVVTNGLKESPPRPDIDASPDL
jgi:hypothetical protein